MADALKALARRPLTDAELRDRLAKREWDSSEIDETLERLLEDGYVDDAKLAFDFIVLRSGRLALGPLKLIGDLRKRGVSEAVAWSAWRQAVDSGDVDLPAALHRRLHKQLRDADRPLDPKGYARVYNALLRAGFESEPIRKELEPYRASEPSRDPEDSLFSKTDEASHDVP